jgi:hypothetical protein
LIAWAIDRTNNGPGRGYLTVDAAAIFQQAWWLSAASGGLHDEVTVKQGSAVIARLAFVSDRLMGFRRLRMPPFTHVLGPVVALGKGKPQTELTRRLSVVRSLIDQLPPFDSFKIALDPSVAGGLANADGLAFQERGFVVKPQYNYRLDCSVGPDKIWEGMDFRTRQHIRRAQQKFVVETVERPEEFIEFYRQNLALRDRQSRFNLVQFLTLFAECRARSCGEVLVARSHDGAPVAMTFLVWDDLATYYLLSTRLPGGNDGDAPSLLIWSGINIAHERGLCFDFDGISTSGIARFYAGFGGRVCNRLIVTRISLAFAAAQFAGGLIRGAQRESTRFT